METVVAKELAVTFILKHHLPLFFLLTIGLCRFHITKIVWSHQPLSAMIGLFEYINMADHCGSS